MTSDIIYALAITVSAWFGGYWHGRRSEQRVYEREIVPRVERLEQIVGIYRDRDQEKVVDDQ